jgi:hypothetical protein
MATFTNATKNTATATNLGKGLTLAIAGQPIGLLLCLTYAGGESIGGGEATFTNQTKN